MSPIDWATLPFKKYADFSGRAPRAEYWWFYLLMIVLYAVAMIVDSLLGMSMVGPYGPATLLVVVGLILPSLAASVRRLHDSNRSGWWLLLPIVPYVVIGFMAGQAMADPTNVGSMGMIGILGLIAFVCAILLLVFMVLPGTKGPNKYGQDPYAGDVA